MHDDVERVTILRGSVYCIEKVSVLHCSEGSVGGTSTCAMMAEWLEDPGNQFLEGSIRMLVPVNGM